MATKSKSTLSETTNGKASSTPATPRVSKLSRALTKSDADSPTPLQNSRHSIVRSARVVNSKPVNSKSAIERRSPKLITPPDKQHTMLSKGSDLLAQMNLLQEDLKKTKEQLLLVEKDKANALDELKTAQKLTDDAAEKLKEAVAAKKQALDDSEIEKFRALEMEQAGIVMAQKKEDKWQREIESVKNQHALDKASLLSTTQDLERLKEQLAMTCDEKYQALSQADDATKIAEIHVEKMEVLSSEVTRLKGLLESKLETDTNERNAVSLLNTEIDSLKQELEKAKVNAEKLEEKEKSIEQLSGEIDSLKQEVANVKHCGDKEREASIEQMNAEITSLKKDLENAKLYGDKLVEREEQMNVEIASLKRDLVNAKHIEDTLAESEASIEQLNVHIVSLKQELAKGQHYEEMLIEREAFVDQLNVEIDSLEQELVKAKLYKEKLMEKEASIEQLNVDLEASKMAESYAQNLLNEWKKRVEELENRSEVSSQLERSATESMVSLEKEIEEKEWLLQNAEKENSDLKEKVELLEISIKRERNDLEESVSRLGKAKQEASKMEKVVEILKCELETVKEEKNQALNNEKLAASSVQSLLEEKNKLLDELENSKEEEEKSKKAMESLTAALHEVSSQAREAKEKFLSIQTEHESNEMEIDDLKNVLKATNEKYESMLDDANHQRELLVKENEESKNCLEKLKAEWEQKELRLLNCIKQTEEENSSKAKEINGIAVLLKQTEEEAFAIKEEESMLKDTLKEVESEVRYLKEVLGEAKAETMRLKESLLDKENELQSVLEENEELQSREADSINKIAELSKLFEEVREIKLTDENGEFTDSEKDYDLLPKVVEFSEQNGHGGEQKLKADLPSTKFDEPTKFDNVNDKEIQAGTDKFENGKPKEEDSVEGEFKMWESCKIEERDYSPARETEVSYEEELDSKVESGDSFDQINSSSDNIDNSATSPSKQQQPKKKKPLLRKFGSLMKKKSIGNEK